MDDRELLDEFVKSRSQSAFRELVERHLPVVYSAAQRMVRDSHLAEEVAQTVFTTLAQKASTIRPPQILGGWLYNTTRHLAMHAVRTEQRRREREQTAAIMQSLDFPPDNPEVLEHLEPAMAELDAEDRDALVLRYLGNRGLRDVGAELGISEDAARKRVNRALDKLRGVLEHRGIPMTSVVLATALTSSIVAVPKGLAATITTTALGKISVATITTAALIAMKTKFIIATIVAAAIIAGTGAYLLTKSKSAPPPAAAPTDKVPIALVNNTFIGNSDDHFLVEVDADTRRTPDSPPAGHIKALYTPAADDHAEFLASTVGTNRWLTASSSIRYYINQGSSIFGKHIRISGWIKTSGVKDWAGATLLVANLDGHIFAEDNMTDRPVRGTGDWQQIEVVTDIPAEPSIIYFAPQLNGTGEIWFDDFQIDVVPAGIPITDDRAWHMWSPNSSDYSVTTDHDNRHDGHAPLCITYTPTGDAPKGSWMWWGEDIRDPKKNFAGHDVRMTVWTKTELKPDGTLRPNLRPKGPNFKLLAQDRMNGGARITGVTDWTQRTILCKIPDDTQCLDTGFAFHGSGKVWIDMDSLKYEIVK